MSALIEKPATRKDGIGSVRIYTKDAKPSLSVHKVIRMAAAKVKMLLHTDDFIDILAVRYIDECGFYICFYKEPVGYPVSPLLEKRKAT